MSSTLGIQVALDELTDSFPLPYVEIVEETEADGGAMVRAGLAVNNTAIYVFVRSGEARRTYALSIESLLNEVIPLLVPIPYTLTKKGKARVAGVSPADAAALKTAGQAARGESGVQS